MAFHDYVTIERVIFYETTFCVSFHVVGVGKFVESLYDCCAVTASYDTFPHTTVAQWQQRVVAVSRYSCYLEHDTKCYVRVWRVELTYIFYVFRAFALG